MGNKLAATFHGTPCDGRCCPRPYGTGPRNPFGTCRHGRACTWHQTEDARATAQAGKAELDRMKRQPMYAPSPNRWVWA